MRQKFRKAFRILGICIGIPALVLTATFFFLFSRFFAIERIDVSASGGIDPADVRSVLFKMMDEPRFLIGENGNIFLFDTKEALDALHEFFAVDEVSLRRAFPDALQITISGKPFAGLWCTLGACYSLSTDGTVSRQVDAAALGVDMSQLPEFFYGTSTPLGLRQKKKDAQRPIEIPIFVDDKNDPISQDSTPLISSAALATARDMVKQLIERSIGVAYIKTHSRSADMTAVTKEGWDILFTPFEEASGQIQNLETVLNTKIKKKRKRLRYIDVRFQNHIYYTFK